MEFEIQRCTRRCAATGRELSAGESYFSALVAEGAQLQRLDFSVEAWQGPPPGTMGWWKSHRPEPGVRPPHWAPNDVMLDFFDRLENQADNQDMRYVLTLLLVRRRVMRLEETEIEAGRETLVLYCPRRDATYRVPAVVPTPERIETIQNELARLLQ